ncbi:MAG: type II secretion system inner membrane protein GspF [Alphaproteobacteria bacterium]|nr:type II secretion system inner membrane protein GspF [Alphaproteobacteria bacterium]
MPTYDYVAIDQNGRTRSGRLASSDQGAARTSVERRGLVLTSLTAGAAVNARPASSVRDTKLGGKPLALVTRQLATLVTVAPLEEALRTLAEQTETPRIRRILENTHGGVVEGLRLSDAMARSGAAFPLTYRAMVSAGETSGALPAILERLADLLEKQQDVRSRVTAALVYPLVLACVATLVMIALMTFVVPKVVDQFNTSGQTLPGLTLGVIFISNLMLNWGWLIASFIVAGAFAFSWGMGRSGFRLAVDRTILGLPVIGRLLRDVEAAGLARSLATMISSGLPILEALQLAGRTTRNSVIRAATARMAIAVSEGAGLSTAMRRSDVFPPLLVYLAANGENSGKLEPMLDRAADYLEREFRTATSIALSLLEPAIIVIMGGVVCLVILSILLPILQINTLAAA